AHISGSATALQQLRFTIDRPVAQMVSTPSPPRPFELPVRVALMLPSGAQGTVGVTIDGLDGDGSLRAHTSRFVALPPSGRVDADFRLDAGSFAPDGAIADADAAPEPIADLAQPVADLPPLADLAQPAVTIAGATDRAVYELEPLSF